MSIKALRTSLTLVFPLVQVLLLVNIQIGFSDETLPTKSAHVATNCVVILYVLHEIRGIPKTTVTSRTHEWSDILTFHSMLFHAMFHEKST